MEASIYIDVVFLFDGIMNSLVLLAAGRLVSPPPKLWRGFLGGFFSAFLECMLLSFTYSLRKSLICSLFLQGAGIFVAYLPKTGKRFFSLLAAVWFCSFLVGGAMSALASFTELQCLFGEGIILQKGMTPWQFVWWAGCVFYVLLHFGGRWLEEHIRYRNCFCNGAITRKGKRCEFRGLLDTGNGLEKDGRGIVVVEFSACLSLFGKDCIMKLLQNPVFSIEEMETEGFSETKFSALGVEQGKILLFRADSLELYADKKKRTYEEIWIGLYFGTFAGGYTALVPPALLEEEEG